MEWALEGEKTAWHVHVACARIQNACVPDQASMCTWDVKEFRMHAFLTKHRMNANAADMP